MTHRRFAILKMTMLSLFISLSAQALAQEKFPSRQVTLVVPQAAGGANDADALTIWIGQGGLDPSL
jgi:tripartite-type tricarboxylate transporter receptor subunit TctC